MNQWVKFICALSDNKLLVISRFLKQFKRKLHFWHLMEFFISCSLSYKPRRGTTGNQFCSTSTIKSAVTKSQSFDMMHSRMMLVIFQIIICSLVVKVMTKLMKLETLKMQPIFERFISNLASVPILYQGIFCDLVRIIYIYVYPSFS